MISTQSTITNVRLSVGSPLLAQVTAPLGNAKYRVGKLAYDYLASILDSSKGRRLTVSEQLEAASDYLDSELAAGW